MTPWMATIPIAVGPRSGVLGPGNLQGAEGTRGGDSSATGGALSWLGDLFVGLRRAFVGGREEAASATMNQSFPQPAPAESNCCCSCCCAGAPEVGVEPWLRQPQPTPTEALHVGTPTAETNAPQPGAWGAGNVEARPVRTIFVPGTSRTAASPRTTFESEVRGQAPREIDLELAAMAQDVYDLDSRGIDGWNRLDEQQLAAARIRPDMLENPKTGFRAAIYTDGNGRYVLAFVGTDAKEIPDWIANFGQGLGLEADQYVQAKRLADRAEQAFGDDLVITGHSLGGGLAAMSALATDSAAVTFNAAGLHDNTIRGLGLTPGGARATAEDGLVRNYVVDGEALTYVQEESRRLAPLAPDAVGRKIELADPHSFWDHLNPLNLWEPSHRVRLHLMDAVLDALRQERPWGSRANAA